MYYWREGFYLTDNPSLLLFCLKGEEIPLPLSGLTLRTKSVGSPDFGLGDSRRNLGDSGT